MMADISGHLAAWLLLICMTNTAVWDRRYGCHTCLELLDTGFGPLQHVFPFVTASWSKPASFTL